MESTPTEMPTILKMASVDFFVSNVALNPGYFVFPAELNTTRNSESSEVIDEGFSDPRRALPHNLQNSRWTGTD